MTFVRRFTQLDEAYAGIFEDFLHFVFVLVADLDNDTRVFRKQNLHDIRFLHLVKFDFQATFYVGKAHFKQRSDQTTCRNVVSGKNQSFVHQLLYCQESVAEVFGILYTRHFVTYLTQ